jgi:hypothetical protein
LTVIHKIKVKQGIYFVLTIVLSTKTSLQI